MQKKTRIICLFALMTGAYSLSAQSIYEPLLQSLKGLSANSKISYLYQLKLTDMNSGKAADSLNGRLVKDGERYVDSSSMGITAVSDGYVCKIIYGSKTAGVYSIQKLATKLHFKFSKEPTVALNVPDSMIRKYGRVTVDSSDKQLYKVSIVFKQQQISKLTATISKVSYSLVALSLEIPEPHQHDRAHNYARVMNIYDIHREVDPSIFNLSRIFTLEGERIVLNKRYTKFKLETLTK